MKLPLPAPGKAAGWIGLAGALAIATGRGDIANLLSNINADTLDGFFKVASAGTDLAMLVGAGLWSLVAGHLSNGKTAA